MSHLPGALLAGSLAAIAATALGAGGCSGASPAPEAAPACAEFPGSVGALSLDADTTAFVDASADLLDLVTNLETTVLDACAGIARDLLVDDTWTAKGPLNRGSADAEVTEACSQASGAVAAALHPAARDAGLKGPIPCGVSVSGGGCTVDANVQGACVATCSGGASCKAPTVLMNCPPDEITGVCSGTCRSSATCEGSLGAPARCQGSCAAGCSGECDGSASKPAECAGTCSGHCVGGCTEGTMVAGVCSGTCTGRCDAACVISQGTAVHCSGACRGTCTGDCKLDASASIGCGKGVDCKGGCTGTYAAPSCEGKLSKPACGADANCQASCQSSALIQASCTSPIVSLACGAPSSAGLQALIATLQANLPALLEAAETEGPLVVDAAATLTGVGQAIAKNTGSLSAKAIACAQAAGRTDSTAEATLMNSIASSASVGAAARSSP